MLKSNLIKMIENYFEEHNSNNNNCLKLLSRLIEILDFKKTD